MDATGMTASYQSKHQNPCSHTYGARVQRAGRSPEYPKVPPRGWAFAFGPLSESPTLPSLFFVPGSMNFSIVDQPSFGQRAGVMRTPSTNSSGMGSGARASRFGMSPSHGFSVERSATSMCVRMAGSTRGVPSGTGLKRAGASSMPSQITARPPSAERHVTPASRASSFNVAARR